MSISESRERVLKAAEALFVERGYEAVTVKDIAQRAGIHHASLYHHIPGGKSDLFVEVITRHLLRHQEGMDAAIDQAQDDVRSRLRHVAAWLLSQPPVDLIRLTQSDLPAINAKEAQELSKLAHAVTIVPIYQVLEEARQRGEIAHSNLGNVAGALFSAIEGLHSIPEHYLVDNRQTMADEIIDIFIKGIQE